MEKKLDDAKQIELAIEIEDRILDLCAIVVSDSSTNFGTDASVIQRQARLKDYLRFSEL